MAKCPYHNIELQQSPHNPRSFICPECKKLRLEGKSTNDGIWDIKQLDNLNNQKNINPGNSISGENKYYLTNDRYVDGRVVQRVLEDVLNINEREVKRIIFETHVYGKCEIECNDSQMNQFNSKMADNGYPQNILRKNDDLEYHGQEPTDVYYPQDSDLEDEWEGDEF